MTLKFSIREIVLITTVIASLLAWWLDHRHTASYVKAIESDNIRWKFRAEYLRGHINATKIDGKWLLPWRIEFDPDSEKVNMPAHQSGEWYGTSNAKIEVGGIHQP